MSPTPAVAPTEEFVDVIANINPDTNEPILGDTTLVLGDGSQKLRFIRGRARAPRSVAERLTHRSDLSIPALGHTGAVPNAAVAAGVVQAATPESLVAEGAANIGDEQYAALEKTVAAKDAELAAKDQQIADVQGQLAALRESVEKLTGEKLEAPEPPAPAGGSEDEESEAVRLAKEHLADEDEGGSEPPVPARVVPEGFEDATVEGEPRCLAKTGAGSQCKNPAVDGGPACSIPAHAQQLAA